MTKPAYVAVDWGTSSFRLWLIGSDGSVLAERRSGEGMTTAAKVGFASVLAGHRQAVSAPETLPVIVCGMAGARQGWVEAGYLDVPAALSAIPAAAVRVPDAVSDIRILPGLAQRDPARPDVIRGEETQLLGALDALSDGNGLVCMPGTHSKWVHIRDGAVTRFSTFMTGELFDAIGKHTILSHSIQDAGPFDGESEAFRQAVTECIRNPGAASNLLFTARSGVLLHGLSATDAKARISGILIGLEIAGALDGAEPGASVTLVASGALGALYESALEAAGAAPTIVDADAAVRSGLAVAARALWDL
ncbi:2-dehydro-3-deoxygalactonokinase [Rhizobium azooxidifex]|uniref:2-dehydro-3-deoxygalactonokinase n=1 Tax=Mycoplana azooxidifex TaxID=1636188 RepID=A0A7W6D802_9HYPH|nr:2-dehydro-3-deoxygalactonokinase [Mycoplana azooxidifex]MBB3975792.1 2-dehydro-3-deoxygalactonokinase [Mycoplana azooxidifex]